MASCRLGIALDIEEDFKKVTHIIAANVSLDQIIKLQTLFLTRKNNWIIFFFKFRTSWSAIREDHLEEGSVV